MEPGKVRKDPKTMRAAMTIGLTLGLIVLALAIYLITTGMSIKLAAALIAVAILIPVIAWGFGIVIGDVKMADQSHQESIEKTPP